MGETPASVTAEQVRAWRWRAKLHGDGPDVSFWLLEADADSRAEMLRVHDRKASTLTVTYLVGSAEASTIEELADLLNAAPPPEAPS